MTGGNFWEQDAVVAGAQPAPSGGVIFSDPSAAREAANEDARVGIAVEGNERSARSTGISDAQALRREFNERPEVRTYNVVLPAFATAITTQPNGMGDLNALYAFVKALDALGAVRGEDVENIRSSVPSAQAWAARLGFQMGENGLLAPASRQQMLVEFNRRVAAANAAYNVVRRDMGEIARRNGIDPFEVVGTHSADPYREQYQQWRRANGMSVEAESSGPRDERPVPEGVTVEGADPETGERYGYRMFDGQRIPWGEMRGTPDISAATDRGIGDASRGQGGVGETVDAFVRGAADTSSFGFADEIAGTGNTMLYGDSTRDSNIDRERAIDAYDAQSHPYARIAGQFGGALLNPLGRLFRAGEGALTVGNMAREGAAYGGLYGLGSGDDAGERVTGGLTGAAMGAAVGGGLGAVVDRVRPAVSRMASGRSARVAEREAERRAFAESALRNPEVPVMRADVPGATLSQIGTALAERSAFGGRVTEARDASSAALGRAVDDVAGRFGVAGDNVAAGDAAIRGANSYIESSQGRVGALYDAIPIPPTRPAELDATRQAFADVATRFASNPELQAAMRDPRLARWQQALENGGLSWNDLKAFRSSIGEIIEGPVLAESASRADMRALYSALSRDMEATAGAVGGRALGAFRRANEAAAERFANIDEVLTPLLGNEQGRSPEQVLQRLQSWAGERGGDYQRLGRFMREIPADDANTIRATIISRLGTATPGTTNAAGDLFSPNTFLSNWQRLGDRARAVLFDGEHRQALDDMVRLAGGMREGRRFANTSETTRGTVAVATIASVWNDIMTGGAAVAGQYSLSRLMANPRSARWLTALANKPNEAAARAHVSRLEAIARSEPVIATDALGLQRALMERFGMSASPTRAAASPNPEQERENGR